MRTLSALHAHAPLALALLLAAAPAALAQTPAPRTPQPDADAMSSPEASGATVPVGTMRLSLDDAIEIALERNYALRNAAYDVENAELQVSEAYGQLFPRADATSSYSRNVVQANPFAGSSAGNIFGGLGAIGWLQFNESARTDDDPMTSPISFQEYNDRVVAGQEAIGFMPDTGANPFGTDNSFQNTIAISQPLYSGTALAAVRGARALVDINRAAVAQAEDEVIHQTRQAFYGALLAQEQARVVEASRGRAEETFGDFTQLVAAGVSPKLDRLNAEVDLANAETQLVAAEAGAQTARDQLLFVLGMPVGAPVVLEGSLQAPEADLFQTVSTVEALEEAVDTRPDLEQARLAIQLNEVQRDITKAAKYPSLSAFANLAYNANVPDNRTSIFAPDPTDPFTFEESSEGFFSDAYWQPSVTMGVSLTWNLFDGFQTRRRVQQNTIAIQKAEVQLEQATQAARLEVANAMRQLQSARQRLAAQAQTVETAETAYAFAQERLDVGTADLVDVRLASQNLDTARLNYLQAVFDALVARSDYERATGAIVPEPVRSAEPTPTTASVR
ncbi:MAG: TolC family protein [Bacteroidota bacterium]